MNNFNSIQTRKKPPLKPKFNLSFDKSPKVLPQLPIDNNNNNNNNISNHSKPFKPFIPRNSSCNSIFNNNFKVKITKNDFKHNLNTNIKSTHHTPHITNNNNNNNNNRGDNILIQKATPINPLDFTFKNSFFPKQPLPNNLLINNVNTISISGNSNSNVNGMFNETPRFKINSRKVKRNPIPTLKGNYSLNNLHNTININIPHSRNHNVNSNSNSNNKERKMKKVNNSCCISGSPKLLVLHPKMKKFFV
jgi:hypothetical protein